MGATAQKYLILATSYVKMARTQRAIAKVYPSLSNTSKMMSKGYMRAARTAYNAYLIHAIYEE